MQFSTFCKIIYIFQTIGSTLKPSAAPRDIPSPDSVNSVDIPFPPYRTCALAPRR